jgi:hypothetical protein
MNRNIEIDERNDWLLLERPKRRWPGLLQAMMSQNTKMIAIQMKTFERNCSSAACVEPGTAEYVREKSLSITKLDDQNDEEKKQRKV